MLVIPTRMIGFAGLIPTILVSGLLLIPNFAFASDLSGSKPQEGVSGTTQKHGKKQLARGHRYIKGRVEAVNDNTIRVDAGEAGDISPRYLNLDNMKGNEEIKQGDMLQIEVNAQNKVVKYQKVSESKKKPTM